MVQVGMIIELLGIKCIFAYAHKLMHKCSQFMEWPAWDNRIYNERTKQAKENASEKGSKSIDVSEDHCKHGPPFGETWTGDVPLSERRPSTWAETCQCLAHSDCSAATHQWAVCECVSKCGLCGFPGWHAMPSPGATASATSDPQHVAHPPHIVRGWAVRGAELWQFSLWLSRLTFCTWKG